jgi:hypothetical protein
MAIYKYLERENCLQFTVDVWILILYLKYGYEKYSFNAFRFGYVLQKIFHFSLDCKNCIS